MSTSSRRRIAAAAVLAAALAAIALLATRSRGERRSPRASAPPASPASPAKAGDLDAAHCVDEPDRAPTPAPAQLERVADVLASEPMPVDHYEAPIEAPAVSVRYEDNELERELVRDYFESQVNPSFRKCLEPIHPQGRVKFSFVFVKDSEGYWQVARSPEDLEYAEVDEGISLLDSTLDEEVDDQVIDCIASALDGTALTPVEGHRESIRYRVFWRWQFGA